jgi:ribosomal protein L11 methyltransferase
LLDVGTGSGILALLAARLGCAPVMAIDNDPDAVAVARQNARANRLEDRLRLAVCADVSVAGRYHLVVANILMKPLLQLAAAISAKVAPGGSLLLSGLLSEQLDEVTRAYQARGLRELERRHDGEWGLLILRARG